jgi:hypothetical protein
LTEATFNVQVIDEFDPIESLSITWYTTDGTIMSQGGTSVRWKSPSTSGVYTLRCVVEDTDGLSSEHELKILVREEQAQSIPLFAYYPMNGDVMDKSGNNRDATMKGVDPIVDARGVANSAYYFNAGSDIIRVANTSDWNFRDAITLSFWVRLNNVNEETFILSHGSWEERWKISVTPDRRLRWTIKTTEGTKDLDNSFALENDVFYHFVAVYSGKTMELYHMGVLDTFIPHGGLISTTNKAITFGRKDDAEEQYFLRGTLDEVRVYNAALNPSEIELLKDQWAVVTSTTPSERMSSFVYPNPSEEFFILPRLKEKDKPYISLTDVRGVRVDIIVTTSEEGLRVEPIQKNPGVYILSTKINNQWYQYKVVLK